MLTSKSVYNKFIGHYVEHVNVSSSFTVDKDLNHTTGLSNHFEIHIFLSGCKLRR